MFLEKGSDHMIVNDVIAMDFISADTEIVIRDPEMKVLYSGNWYEDRIDRYLNNEVESFTWQNDDTAFIDIKESDKQ